MKLSVLVLASVLLVGLTLGFMSFKPVAVTAKTGDALACPGSLCIINQAEEDPEAPDEGRPFTDCYASTGEQCDQCCEEFQNMPSCLEPYGKIVGIGWCWCTMAQTHRPCDTR